jgi:hypothetical protein
VPINVSSQSIEPPANATGSASTGETFYDANSVVILPTSSYYSGTGKSHVIVKCVQ